ncbi:hypothetical protein BKA70DRAFT_1472862, partial [Coprinopsis sp. MPI-PUGE-AT-0042]
DGWSCLPFAPSRSHLFQDKLWNPLFLRYVSQQACWKLSTVNLEVSSRLFATNFALPRIQYAHSVIHEWRTGHEPEEIGTIRWSLLKEVKGGCDACFPSGFYDFLESGPISMLLQIVIEEVIQVVLEPLHGKPWAIPCRFVETFEHIHLAVGMACDGTAASRFIANRQYQLDESATDATARGVGQRMPRCEASHHDGNEKNDNGWLTCHHCGTKFNACTSIPVEAKAEELDEEKKSLKSAFFGHQTTLIRVDRETNQSFSRVRNGGSSSQPEAVSQEDIASRVWHDVSETLESLDQGDVRLSTDDNETDIDDELWASDAKMAKLFRRIKFEVEPEIKPSIIPPTKPLSNSLRMPPTKALSKNLRTPSINPLFNDLKIPPSEALSWLKSLSP